MLNLSEVELSGLSVHKIGNKSRAEGMVAASEAVSIDDESMSHVLKSYFIDPFKNHEFYHFTHDSDLLLNEVYSYAKSIFLDPEQMHLQSIRIAKHLYEQSEHPQIKSGELYVAHFEHCLFNGFVTDMVGIFKSENKDTYLKVYPQGRAFAIDKEEGININKLDKGCLIINDGEDEGYKVLSIDRTNHEDARYWKGKFLRLAPLEDAFYHTRHYMQMCKSFAAEALQDADRVDQVALMNKSARFFDEEQLFDQADYKGRVLKDAEVIEAFEDYQKDYQQQNDVLIDKTFEINRQAVKKMKHVFKSVIKLDKNFHIYVHGDKTMITKGYDTERRQNYYQLYYNSEQ
jgi:hypothetical protein